MMFSRTSFRIVLSTLLLITVLSAAFAEQPLFRFIQISDTQPRNEEMWANSAHAVRIINDLQPQPAFVLFAGDLTDRGLPIDVDRIAAIVAHLRAPLYAIPGNHDVPPEWNRLPYYQKHFGPEHWSMRYGNFKFVGLNTLAPYFMDGSDSDFVQWVEQELGDPTTPNRFVIGHLNLWDYNPANGVGTPLGNPAWLSELFYKEEVIAYLHGHDHKFRHGYPAGRKVKLFSGSVKGFETMHVSSWTVGNGGGFLGVDVYPEKATLLKCDLQGGVEEVGTMTLKVAAKLPGPTPMQPWPGAVKKEAILAR